MKLRLAAIAVLLGVMLYSFTGDGQMLALYSVALAVVIAVSMVRRRRRH
jgi:hypothetical protein